MERIILIVITPIKIVVDDDHRTVIVTQRAPPDIVISAIPMDPGRSPVPGGDPIPSQAKSPMPATVVRNAPAPRFIRNPCPAANRIPGPSPVIIRAPGVVIDTGNPNITVRPLVCPTAVIIQLSLILIQFDR
jgi:hypothetical protein